MSKPIGNRLPAGVVGTFDGTRLDEKIGLGYLLVTDDADGGLRPCMLSCGEILVPDDRHLRLALWAGSHTSANLARGADCLLCYLAEGTVLYIRGPARPLGTIERLGVDCFEVEVSGVDSDDHPGMPVVDTFRFAVPGRPIDSVVREWEERVSALGEL